MFSDLESPKNNLNKGYASLIRFELQYTVMLNDKINHILNMCGNHLHTDYFEAYLIL